MLTLNEGEIVKSLRDGNLFKVKMVSKDFVILDALDWLSQIMAGKRGFDFMFESIPPSLPFPEFTIGRALAERSS
jgi:hypothetical protein